MDWGNRTKRSSARKRDNEEKRHKKGAKLHKRGELLWQQEDDAPGPKTQTESWVTGSPNPNSTSKSQPPSRRTLWSRAMASTSAGSPFHLRAVPRQRCEWIHHSPDPPCWTLSGCWPSAAPPWSFSDVSQCRSSGWVRIAPCSCSRAGEGDALLLCGPSGSRMCCGLKLPWLTLALPVRNIITSCWISVVIGNWWRSTLKLVSLSRWIPSQLRSYCLLWSCLGWGVGLLAGAGGFLEH